MAILVLLAAPLLGSEAPRVDVGQFSRGSLEGWEVERFQGETRYALVEQDGTRMLRGSASASASGLVRKITVDLRRTPILNWSWKTTALPHAANEREKSGDDFALRIYVVISGGVFFWQTRALNYVWSAREPVDSTWPNPFTANATMLVVESGPGALNQWRHYRRDLRADIMAHLGLEPGQIDAVALMVDTDNSGTTALSYFGDIYFSAE